MTVLMVKSVMLSLLTSGQTNDWKIFC